MTVSSVLIGLLVLIGLIVLNGLFVAAEYALVSIRKSRVEEMVNARQPGAQTIQQLKANLERSIAGSQLGITLSSLAIGWFGGKVVEALFQHLVGYVPTFGLITPTSLVVLVSFLFLSLTQVIIGEQIPKQLALRLPERVIILLSTPFRVFCWIMTPAIWLMSSVAALALKLLGVSQIAAEEHPLPSTDEFQILIEESEKAGTLGKEESRLLQRALELKALTVREVMVPRVRMDCVGDHLSLAEVLQTVCRTKHSKLPVFHVSRDNVIGILSTRDLFELWSSTQKLGVASEAKPFKLSSYVRRAYFAPDTMLASTLLEEMKKRRLQMAIVVDEFGATVGLITLEDLLEQLVGEIWDEYDTPTAHSGIEAVGEGVWHVPGETTLFEFNKALAASVTATHSATIAGAVIEALDHQPTVDETTELDGFQFTVLEMRGNAVSKLQVKRLEPKSESQAAPEEPAPPAQEPGSL